MKIKVTRPFFLNGKIQEMDARIDVDDRFGREMIHNGKCVPDLEVSDDAGSDAMQKSRKDKK